MLPRDVVLRTCSADSAAEAVRDGSVVEVEWHGEAAWALPEVADSEEMLADGLLALAEENRLAVVVGPEPEGRAAALARALGSGVRSVVLDDAHLVGVDAALAAVEDLPEDAVLAICLDNALPLGEVLGSVALDVAASSACPVLQSETPRDANALAAARREVAAGRWPRPRPDDKSLVVVAVTSPEEALVRVGQLVGTSIPRAFSHTGSAITVLTLDADGPVGVGAVQASLAGTPGGAPDVRPLSQAASVRAAAAVIVLPGVVTPALTRAALYAGLRAGADHVSVVHGFGADATALAEVVSSTTDRPRRTRLAELLTP